MNYAGLTSARAEELLGECGPNEVGERKKNAFKRILKWLVSPISLMFVGALFLTWLAGRAFDFYLIFILAFLNFFISFWQERKADHAIESLRKQLTVQTKTLRDGAWGWVESKYLVPGDAVEIDAGDLITADLAILSATNASINEAALTGESLPKERKEGDSAHSGSFLTTGTLRGKVIATGKSTEFGKTLFLIDESLRRSALEKDILSISRMISTLSVAVMVIFSAVFLMRHALPSDLFLVDLSLLIAGIPISLPTVMSIIIALGITELAKNGVIVRRLASLEDLADVDLLLTDKTGTLTQNRLNIQNIISYAPYSDDDVIMYALYTTAQGRSEIDQLIIRSATGLPKGGTIMNLIPADSERKRSTAIVKFGNTTSVISLGATQVIAGLCSLTEQAGNEFEAAVKNLADKGYRALAVAINRKSADERAMELVGIIAFADQLRSESKEVVDFLNANGVTVKMVTGDNILISKNVASGIGLHGEIADGQELKNMDWKTLNQKWFESHAVFSEVMPVDKYHLVEFAKRFHVVAVTGDGVNDLPALKIADVGIAVSNAVDALKSAADIALLSVGIDVIKNALIEARKIFARLYVYSVYRISESFRLIITIGVLGILYGSYPLTAIQLIILALLNDIPIISLAFNRVNAPKKPTIIHPKKRFLLASLFGLSGIINSLILFFALVHWTNLSIPAIQTIYFLKLTVSGHMLLYVAHTKERWYKFLPSRSVILATTITQLVSSAMAGFGIFMAPISPTLILFVWVWAFLWMQVSEAIKNIPEKLNTVYSTSLIL